jgi:hypothetical protein
LDSLIEAHPSSDDGILTQLILRMGADEKAQMGCEILELRKGNP